MMSGYDFEHVAVMLVSGVPVQMLFAYAVSRYLAVERKALYWTVQIVGMALMVFVFWEIGSWQRIVFAYVLAFAPILFGPMPFWTRLVVTFMSVIVMALTEFPFSFAWMVISGEPVANYDVVYPRLAEFTLLSIVNLVIVFLIYVGLGKLLKRLGLSRDGSVSNQTFTLVNFLWFPAVQLALALLMNRVCESVSDEPLVTGMSVAVIGLFLLTDVVILLAVAISARKQAIEARSQALEERIDASTKEFRGVAQEVERVARLRHDVRNHVLVVEALWKRGDADEAREMCRQLQQEFE